MTETRNRPNTQAVAERRAEALRLRRMGRTYAEVADTLGYSSPQSASKDVSRALAKVVHEEGHALLALERERTETLLAITWPLAEAGDTRAIREAVRILERRARMLGLDKVSAADQSERHAAEGRSLVGRLVGFLAENPPVED